MTQSDQKAPYYPKSHLLAASGVAALLSLALLVFPSAEVEAKKTTLNLELENGTEQILQEKDDLRPNVVTEDGGSSPFAQIEGQPDNQNSAGKDAEKKNDLADSKQQASPTASADPAWKSVTVGKGDTLSTVFAKAGLPANVVHDMLAANKDAKQFTRLDIGQDVDFLIDTKGELQGLKVKRNDLETISLNKSAKGYDFKRDLVKPSVHANYAHGRVDSSLFVAGKNAGLSHDLIMSMANVLGYDIDFAQDIREGDSFDVIYESQQVQGKQVGTGSILAVRFVNRGKEYTAVRYTSKQGSTSYLRADGSSMRKAFIRTPVDFARISSRFSAGRKHPILNKIRAHKGVDYAAPRGTPIKAAGDGKVLLAGRRGGYGNTVIIQHGNRYQTLYGHMQGFAKGVKTGGTVKQGQVIGYIGTTGLSTGPHLHYEFQVNGVHVDPLGQKLPMADPIAKAERQRFLQQSQPLVARMNQEKATMLASNKR